MYKYAKVSSVIPVEFVVWWPFTKTEMLSFWRNFTTGFTECCHFGSDMSEISSKWRNFRSNVDVVNTVYPKKYAHGFCFAVLCCGYTLTDFPISTRLTSLALWQSNDCPSAGKATLMNMDTSCEIIMNDYITTTKQSTKNRVHIYWDILYLNTLACSQVSATHLTIGYHGRAPHLYISCNDLSIGYPESSHCIHAVFVPRATWGPYY